MSDSNTNETARAEEVTLAEAGPPRPGTEARDPGELDAGTPGSDLDDREELTPERRFYSGRRNKTRLLIAALLVALAGAAALGIITRIDTPLSPPTSGSVLRIIIPEPSPNISLDPYPQAGVAVSTHSKDILDLALQGLTGAETKSPGNDKSIHYQETLAAKIQLEKGHWNRYLVTLKDDIFWHDHTEEEPRPLTARDVICTWDILSSASASGNATAAEVSRVIKDIQYGSAKAGEDSERRLVIVTKRHIHKDLLMGWLTFKVLPSHKLEGVCQAKDPYHQYSAQGGPGVKYRGKPVGTGPFRVVKGKTFGWVTMELGLGAKQHGPFSRITFTKFITDRPAIIKTFRTGEDHDLIYDLFMREAKGLEDFEHQDYAPYSFYAIAVRADRLKDRDLRRYLACWINHEKILEAIDPTGDTSQINRDIFPNNSDVVEYTRLQKKAGQPYPTFVRQRLSALTGYEVCKNLYDDLKAKDGKFERKPLRLAYFAKDNEGMGGLIAKAIANPATGGALNIEPVAIKTTPKEFMEGRAFTDYDMVLAYYDGFNRAYNIKPLFDKNSPMNLTNFSDPPALSKQLQEELHNHESAYSIELRAKAANAINKIVLNEGIMIPLFTLQRHAFWREKTIKTAELVPGHLFVGIKHWESAPAAKAEVEGIK